MSQVEELKAKANAAFSANKTDEAIDLYTQALALDDKNHVLYSNRSAAYAKANKYQEALKDAEKCLELKPDFVKGYSRKGAALSFLKRYDDAIKVYNEGLALDSQNAQLLADLETAKKDKANNSNGGSGMPSFFSDPQFLAQMATSPKARELMKDPETAMLVRQMQQNPTLSSGMLSHPKVMKLLGAVLGFEVGMGAPGAEDDDDAAMDFEKPSFPNPSASSSTKPSSKPPPPPTPPKTSDNDKNKNLTAEQNQAEQEKEKGNEAYKKKDFETALAHYTKAIELDPSNMAYHTNRAAVYFEQKNWEECLKECDKAIDIGRENKADYKIIAKAFARMGNVKVAQNDLQGAIKYFNSSLSEHRNPDILRRKQDIEKELKEQERKAMINPELAEEEKKKGNAMYEKGDYPNALKHYSDAIKRNPTDARLYSNRAACYAKLMEYNLALKDAEEGIKLDPTFVKAYLRKGNSLMMMKDLGQAMAAFGKALELDPNCKEAIEGYRQCTIKANSDPEEVRKRAMADPEVREIMEDPGMRMILEQMQNDPRALREHLKNPSIASKIQKLIDVGVIAVR